MVMKNPLILYIEWVAYTGVRKKGYTGFGKKRTFGALYIHETSVALIFKSQNGSPW